MSKERRLTERQKNERVAAYIFTSPAMILLVAFLLIPMFYTIYYSLFKYQVMRPDDITFLGLENAEKYSLFLCHRGSCAVRAGAGPGASGIQTLQGRCYLPDHVLWPAVDVHGGYLRPVGGTLQLQSQYRTDQLHARQSRLRTD